MKPISTFQSHPVNFINVQDERIFIQQGIESWCSLVLTVRTETPGTSPVWITLDGTYGADFHSLLHSLGQVCEKEGIPFKCDFTAQFVKTESELKSEMASYLTDNRAFGYTAHDVHPQQYFQEGTQEALENRACELETQGGIHVLCGPGAAMLTQRKPDLCFYADYSRENQQIRHAQGMGSFGFSNSTDKVETYKNCYFLQWPVWESYRQNWLAHYTASSMPKAYYIDLNQPGHPVWLAVDALQNVLHLAAQQPFRVKPFFAPGIWGGQFLKQLANLPEEWPNCAWSFEPIAPENTLLLEVQDITIEIPFTLLMEAAPYDVMGVRNVELFGDYFPIRFDYLDTMKGGELSLQVHPKQSYIESHFNEHMTQQESYYIMEHTPGAKVYLGLKEGVNGASLLSAVEDAHHTETPLILSSYVNEYLSEKGALYLIPPGTVHCSGRENMVLEISSTPWWFTFKIYDYLRLDRDGKPRPLNPEHARHNIDDNMTTSTVEQGLIARPQVVKTQGCNTYELLGQRHDLLFQVSRLSLHDTWEADTCGEFVMFNLVEGERVRLVPTDNEAAAVEWGYAEAYIIPASVGKYRLENLSGSVCKLIAAKVNPTWNLPLLPPSWTSCKEASYVFRW